MPKIAYEDKRLGPDALDVIAEANGLLEQYADQDYSVTLRQLYYRFVALDLFPDDRTFTYIEATRKWVRDPNGTKNAEPNYKWLGTIVNDGRLGGLIDWEHIVDRTRELDELPHWANPTVFITQVAKQFRIPLWEPQPNYVEVWVEKDALEAVVERPCRRLDVPFFSCRGYTGQSAMWEAGQRLLERLHEGKSVKILHLGDHDPSGIDMTRDIEDRTRNFVWQDFLRDKVDEGEVERDDQEGLRALFEDNRHRLEVERIALNMDQVRQYNPPPNPAKMGDSRFKSYRRQYGSESWELDALDPPVIDALITTNVEKHIDSVLWNEAVDAQQEGKDLMAAVSARWSEVKDFLGGGVMLPPDMAQRMVELGEFTDDDLSWLTDQVDEQEENDDGG